MALASLTLADKPPLVHDPKGMLEQTSGPTVPRWGALVEPPGLSRGGKGASAAAEVTL